MNGFSEIPERYNASTLIDANLASGRGDKIAIRCGEENLSYAELLMQVSRMGHALRRLGVRAGERVVMVLGDTPIFPTAFFGCLRLGAVPCPINPLIKDEDVRFFIEDAGAAVVITDAMHCEKVVRALADAGSEPLVLAPGETAGRLIGLDEALAAEDAELAPAATHRDDMAFWLYSGGSTGRPKAVVHSHQDIPWTCETYARHVLRLDGTDTVFARVLFHAYGLGGGLTFPFWAGATSVLLPGRPTPAALLDAIARHRPTVCFLVPTLYTAILNDPAAAGADLGSLRLCVSAAEPLPPETWRRWRDAFGLEILDGLGSTEMLHIFCSNTEGAVRPGSSGRPVPGYALRLVDEAGAPVAGGDTGTLEVSGESAASGYWRQRAKTRATMRGGWVSTGDRYRVDAEGFYWYEGRADDMIKIGGEWVSPIEMENVLVEHAGVLEAAVVGVPVEGILRIRAAVVLADGQEASAALTRDLQEWCKNRLQRYQYPHAVDFVAGLPKTATGKVQRFRLREAAIR